MDTTTATPAAIEQLAWHDIARAALDLVSRVRLRGVEVESVYGVPTGGAPVAVMVAHHLRRPLIEEPEPGCLVVDDLVDSGRTLRPLVEAGFDVEALYRKPHSPPDIAPGALVKHGWLSFPWERAQGAPVDAVVRLLQYVGEDPTRDGLADTPRRVVKALAEMTRGYRLDPASILAVDFDVAAPSGPVISAGLPFVSLCEHHLLAFTGTATIAYRPSSGRVVGLSKLARVLDAYACRLQVQEKMTRQIAAAIEQHLRPAGVAVLISASHSCQEHRGVRKRGVMLTSHWSGDWSDADRDLITRAHHDHP